MLEELQGRVKVEDAEPVILRQLIRYLYTGRVGPEFRDYKKLMVLANKYQVEDLVDYTSKKILETLAKDNALELGSFGETHNSTILLNATAQFIQENLSPETLPEGWEQQLKGSPRLTLAIIGAAREKGKVTEFARFTSAIDMNWCVGPNFEDCIGFQVSSKAQLVGVGMYGVPGTDNKVALKINHGSQLLFEAEMNYHSNGGEAITNLQLEPAVQLEANTRYEMTTQRLSEAVVSSGRHGKPLVQAGEVDVHFFTATEHGDGATDVDMGQIPAIYLRV